MGLHVDTTACVFYFLIFRSCCRALDKAGSPVSFLTHKNIPCRIVLYRMSCLDTASTRKAAVAFTSDPVSQRRLCKRSLRHYRSHLHYVTSVSVHLILGRKCTLAASRAAPWRVTLSMRRNVVRWEGQTGRCLSLTARCGHADSLTRNENRVTLDVTK